MIRRSSVHPRYVFRILDTRGQVHMRPVFWQRCYAFLHGRRTALAAARVVPHAEDLFALYLALRSRMEPTHPELPMGPATASIVRDLQDVLARREVVLPGETHQEAERALVQAVEEVLAPHAPVLEAMERAGIERDPLRRGSRLTGLLGGLSEEDTGPVHFSQQVGQLLRDRIEQLVQQRLASAGDASLALRRDVERELQRELYREPRFLRFVLWCMDLGGGFVSPVVRDFLRFSYWELVDRAQEAEEDHVFTRERLEAMLGAAEAEVSHTLPCHDLTVLGYLAEGSLPADAEDPWHTPRSYQVSPTADLSGVVLTEIGRLPERAVLNAVIRSASRANIARIRYLGARRIRRPASGRSCTRSSRGA